MTPAQITRELQRRARARESLHTFALSVDIPTVPVPAPCPDEDLIGPAEILMARHHAAILHTLQRTVTRSMGRCIIMAPPGSAKSIYSDALLIPWCMGKWPGSRYILTSYASTLAEKQSRRAQFVVAQSKYRDLWAANPTITKDAAHEWALSNRSEMLAMGLLAGLTGNRANGAVIDDPVAGREEADSEATRQKIMDAYQDDLLTRLLPGAWVVLILTRWNEDDLAGRILPEDYAGQSGMIQCRDGLMWEVLNLPAKAEHVDDPLGRQLGEYIWPEFYPIEHWHMFEKAKGAEAARTWSSLYQQRPTPQGSGRFDMTMFDFYEEGTQPPVMAYIGAGDYAVTEGGNDFTELGVFGIDPAGDLWEVDWWSKQSDTGTSCEKTLDLIAKWKIPMWFNEGGVIDKAMGPLINLRMRQRKVYADRRAIASMADKVAKCASFQGRAAAGGEREDGTWKPGTVHFRNNANSRRVVNQLVALPAGRYDDAADVCGLVGRAIDQFPQVRVPSVERKEGIKPFTVAWLEHTEQTETRRRAR